MPEEHEPDSGNGFYPTELPKGFPKWEELSQEEKDVFGDEFGELDYLMLAHELQNPEKNGRENIAFFHLYQTALCAVQKKYREAAKRIIMLYPEDKLEYLDQYFPLSKIGIEL